MRKRVEMRGVTSLSCFYSLFLFRSRGAVRSSKRGRSGPVEPAEVGCAAAGQAEVERANFSGQSPRAGQIAKRAAAGTGSSRIRTQPAVQPNGLRQPDRDAAGHRTKRCREQPAPVFSFLLFFFLSFFFFFLSFFLFFFFLSFFSFFSSFSLFLFSFPQRCESRPAGRGGRSRAG